MANRWLKRVVVGVVYLGFLYAGCYVIGHWARQPMYDASASVTDIRLLTQGPSGVPEHDADKHIAELIKVMKSEPILEETGKTLIQFQMVTNPQRILRALEVQQRKGTDIIWASVRSDSEAEAKATVSVLISRFIQREGGASIKVIDEARTVPVDTRRRLKIIVFLGLTALLPGGILTGRSLGRRFGIKPGFVALVVCGLTACLALALIVRSNNAGYYRGYVTLTDRSAPWKDIRPSSKEARRHLADLAEVVRGRAAAERAVETLLRLNVCNDPLQACSTLQVKPVEGSNELIAEVRYPGEAEAKRIADIVAEESVQYYAELTSSANPPVVQRLRVAGPAKAAKTAPPVLWIAVAFLSIPIWLWVLGMEIGSFLGRRARTNVKPTT